MLRSIILWDATLLLSVTYGWMRGGRPERIAAAALLASAMLDAAATSPGWRHIQFAPGVTETALLVVLFYLALTSDRWWPVPMVSAQLIACTARLIPIFDPATRPYAAYFSEVAWDYLTLGALVIGTALEARHSLARDSRHA